jgi:hypothetical protein
MVSYFFETTSRLFSLEAKILGSGSETESLKTYESTSGALLNLQIRIRYIDTISGRFTLKRFVYTKCFCLKLKVDFY